MFGTKILVERKSKYNGDLKVIRALGLGTYIQAGNLTQSGGIVESMWKQTIKKVASSKKQVVNILILGLGGGTLVKVIKKYYPGVKITGVDIDPIIVDLGKKYLKIDFFGVDIKISDAFSYCKQSTVTGKKFDLIFVDLYNGDLFPKKFESKNYLRLIKTLLSKSGVAIFNRLYYKEKKLEAEKFGEDLKKIFKNVEMLYPLVNSMFISRP